mmetsp:Transcript_15441/g.48707  ORF Transcript_15441/g.48707 Transcript_15441/m.48707 type:complete len:208 (+) Transcript_15441:410-1033(+)
MPPEARWWTLEVRLSCSNIAPSPPHLGRRWPVVPEVARPAEVQARDLAEILNVDDSPGGPCDGDDLALEDHCSTCASKHRHGAGFPPSHVLNVDCPVIGGVSIEGCCCDDNPAGRCSHLCRTSVTHRGRALRAAQAIDIVAVVRHSERHRPRISRKSSSPDSRHGQAVAEDTVGPGPEIHRLRRPLRHRKACPLQLARLCKRWLKQG